MMKRFTIAVFCLMMTFVGLQDVKAQDNIIDQIEWVVGDKIILRSDIETAIRHWRNSGMKFEGDPYCIVGEELAVQQLFLHQAALDSLQISEIGLMQMVDAEIEQMILEAGSKERMELQNGASTSQIREMLYEIYYNKNMADMAMRNIVGDISEKVSPALVRRFYNTLPADSIPYIHEQVEVQIITIEPDPDMEEIDRIKSEMREYTEKINNGEARFSTLATLYSECPSARRGGELGYSSRGEFAPEFAAVAFSLTDPSKVSKIVETEYGFHIIQLIDKRGDRVNVRHILRKPRVSSDNVKAMMLRLDSIATDIRADKFTFDEGAYHISHDKDTRNNNGLLYNKETGISHFQLQDLPTDVARAIDNLQVGEISAPFIMLQPSGKTVCAIAKLKSRTDGHNANMKDDYDVIKNLYISRKSDERLKQWIKEKQNTTYVRVNKKNRDYEFKYPGWIFYED